MLKSDNQAKKSKELSIHKRKIFERNLDTIFEQDFAQPNCTNANQIFMEQKFPAHIPTLWRYQDIYGLFLVRNETIFGVLSGFGQFTLRVFIATNDPLISRGWCDDFEWQSATIIRTLWRNSLINEFPAKMNEIYRLKGAKLPSNFNPWESPFACKCKVYTSWLLKVWCMVKFILFKTLFWSRLLYILQTHLLFWKWDWHVLGGKWNFVIYILSRFGWSVLKSVRHVFKIASSVGKTHTHKK